MALRLSGAFKGLSMRARSTFSRTARPGSSSVSSLFTRSFASLHETMPGTATKLYEGVKDDDDIAMERQINKTRFADKLKRFKPITPSLRHTVLIDRSELYKGRPIRNLTEPKPSTGGRGHKGQICVRHRGGGHKKKYRLVDFKRSKVDMTATVERLEFDPNRSGYIALIKYEDGKLAYILAPQDLEPGTVIQSTRDKEIDIKVGNSMPLALLPIGTWIHNVELIPGKGGQLGRSAGTSCQLMSKSGGKKNYGLVRLASKEQRYIHLQCMATVGLMSNPLFRLRKLGKAGRARWLGRRPTVRGIAMNPVDHPHGGGEGRNKGRVSCSPTGILAKCGFKTRKRPKNKLVIVPRGGLRAKN